MGKFSRDKGARRERELVKIINSEGFKALRVPLSGAAQGFKSDVIVNDTIKIEVKTRAKDFNGIYNFLDKISKEYPKICSYQKEGSEQLKSITIYSKFSDYTSCVSKAEHRIFKGTYKTLDKLFKMQELLGEAELLAIKGDHKPWLFISYE